MTQPPGGQKLLVFPPSQKDLSAALNGRKWMGEREVITRNLLVSRSAWWWW